MAISESQKLSIAKYRQEKRDRISTDVPKGKREVYNCAAKDFGISLSMLIQNAVEEYIRNHAGESFLPSRQETTKLSPSDEKLLAEFSKLPADAQKSLMKFLQSISPNVDNES